jgi:cytidylate kinase
VENYNCHHDENHGKRPVIKSNLYAINVIPNKGYNKKNDPEADVKVITVSHTYGSGGSEFANKMADRLGYTYIDEALSREIEKNPRECSALFCSIEDEVEPGFLDKVTGLMSSKSFFKTTLAICIYELALKTDIVLVGSGGHLILAGCPSHVSIQILSKLSDRVRTVAHAKQIKPEDAMKLTEHKDKEKSHFVNYYFDKNLFDPLMFHFTINASLVLLNDALDMMDAYNRDFSARLDSIHAEQFLKDRLLEKKADMVLLHLDISHGGNVKFQADKGVITVHGVVGSDHEKGRLFDALKKMGETKDLVDQIKTGVLSRNIY